MWLLPLFGVLGNRFVLPRKELRDFMQLASEEDINAEDEDASLPLSARRH